MKIKITMKDPDGVYDCVRDGVNASIDAGLSKQEREAVVEVRSESVNRTLSRWFEYGEYLTVEVDTALGTITVLEATR